MKKKALFCSFLLALVCCLAGCSSSSTSGMLKVGVRDDILNFSYYNKKSDDYYGLEDDIARELANRLGYSDVEFVTVEPDTRKDMLLDGKVDCLISTYSITDTRKENFDFSSAYYTDKSVLMVETSSLIDDVNDLKNKTIGIMSGSNTGAELAIRFNELGLIGDDVISNTDEKTEYQGLTVLKYESYDALIDGLEIGEVDAAAMDGCIAQTYLTDSRSILDFTIKEQKYGVATQKGSGLSKEVKKAIKEMKKDKTIKKLIDKWD